MHYNKCYDFQLQMYESLYIMQILKRHKNCLKRYSSKVTRNWTRDVKIFQWRFDSVSENQNAGTLLRGFAHQARRPSPSVRQLYAFFVQLAKFLKTNAIHKLTHETNKILITSNITLRPFGDPSTVCQQSSYSLSTSNYHPEKIYTITQKEYIFLHERYTLFCHPTRHAHVVSNSCDDCLFDLHCHISACTSLLYCLFFSNSMVFDLMSLPAHHSKNGMSPKS